MSVIQIVEATGKCQCRMEGPSCIVEKRFGKIPKGRKVLKISLYRDVGFYCEECMKGVFDECTKAMNET